MPISDHLHLKIIETTFNFPKFAPACKISVHSIYSFLRYCQFESPVTRLTIHIFDHVHLIFFWSTFNLFELVSTCKKSDYFIFWGDRVDQKILQSDMLRTFWPISQEQKFSQIWDLRRNTTNNISFHYRTNSVKINNQIFQ